MPGRLRKVVRWVSKKVAPKKYAENKEARVSGLKFAITRLEEQIRKLEENDNLTQKQQIELDSLFERLEETQWHASREGLRYKKERGKIVWIE